MPSPVVHHYAPTLPQAPQYQPSAPRVSQPTQQFPPLQGQQGGAGNRSHAGKIGTIAPGSNFDPTIQDQSKQCEYHRGAPGHTLDTCWRLREMIQEMIDAKELVFNAVRSPNVQANPLPDHGPARGPSINMIPICTSGEGESEQGCPSPFVIEYVSAEAAVRFTGIDASLTLFIIDVPTREPYSDDKVPWTYEGSVGSLEQQLGVMGITRSGRVYENSAVIDKGKAPAAETEVIPGVLRTPPKRVTEEEAEAFMKIIKMNIDLNRVRPSKTAVRAYDGSRRELKFIVEERIITVKGEEDYAIYKETTVPYISVGNDENLPFHSFETISVIWDYREVGPSRADRMIGNVLLRHNYIPGTGLGAREQGINRPIEVEEYKHRRGLGFRPS
ncbi:hypothetical protein CRG98_016886 [Punica granatum]|uniref:G-patch domain-containing protein n=1 Tax=Punica granatum TaxID=22663 RepID=A0A2I0K3M5_PUNGR|nr:hypothetical protein CRG98_016886 [Punica granatum]